MIDLSSSSFFLFSETFVVRNGVICGNYFILGGKRGERGEQTGRSLFSQKDKNFLFFHNNPETS